MEGPVRWVSKAEAAQELEISPSTLDRKIRRGEIEAAREGRRVYVRMHGPEYLSDDELLRLAFNREDELKRAMRQLERATTELERERDEARDAASASEEAYRELEWPMMRAGRAPQNEAAGTHPRLGRSRAVRAAGRQCSRRLAVVHIGGLASGS